MDTGHWTPENLIRMVHACVDDVTAYTLAFNAIQPAELRAMSHMLGIAHIDTLRDLTRETVVVVRGLDGPATEALDAWISQYRSRGRNTAVAAYLDTIGRTRDDH